MSLDFEFPAGFYRSTLDVEREIERLLAAAEPYNHTTAYQEWYDSLCVWAGEQYAALCELPSSYKDD